MAWYRYDWKPYVPVAQRRAQAQRAAGALAKKSKRPLAPVKIEGRKIATSFWGKAWCENLERYSDFSNRLPRGRTYVRNGSVLDLQIAAGAVKALVSGSSLYTVTIKISKLSKPVWKRIREDCSQSIDSLIDLLRGRFEQPVMERLSRKEGGLFPQPAEITMDCSCPDWAGVCKHVAATLYGVGARLDADPELLFTLRDVDHLDLIGQAVASENLDKALGLGKEGALAGNDLGELFGIELEQESPAPDAPGTDELPPKIRGRKSAATASAVSGVVDPAPGARKRKAGVKTTRSKAASAPKGGRRTPVRLDRSEPAATKKPRAGLRLAKGKLRARSAAVARAK